MSLTPQQHNHHTSLNARLKRAFPYTDEDLAANRGGQLTDAQKALLRSRQDVGFLMGCLSVASLLTIGCLVLPFLSSSTFRVNRLSSSLILLLLLGGLLMAVALVVTVFEQQHITQDIGQREILAIQGKITFTRQKSGMRVVLGQNSFPVSSLVAEAFVEGERYILYYTPKSQTLVSAEHVLSPS